MRFLKIVSLLFGIATTLLYPLFCKLTNSNNWLIALKNMEREISDHNYNVMAVYHIGISVLLVLIIYAILYKAIKTAIIKNQSDDTNKNIGISVSYYAIGIVICITVVTTASNVISAMRNVELYFKFRSVFMPILLYIGNWHYLLKSILAIVVSLIMLQSCVAIHTVKLRKNNVC